MNLRLIFIILFFGNNLFSQSVNKDDFNRLVDYCACNIAYSYTSQFAAKNLDSKENKSFEESISPAIENCDIKNPISFIELSELLQNNNYESFGSEELVIINDLKKEFNTSFTNDEAVKSIINGIYTNKNLKKIIDAYSGLKDLKERLRSELNDFLFDETSIKEQSNEIEANRDEIYSSNSQTPIKKQSLIWPSLILFSLVIILLVYFYSRFNKRIKKLTDSHANVNDKLNEVREIVFDVPKNTDKSSSENFRSNHYDNEILKLDDQIFKLKNKIDDLEQKKELVKEDNTDKKEVVFELNTKKADSLESQIYYATKPTQKGEFLNSSLSENEKNSKCYILTLISENQASFEFFNFEDSVLKATNSPERFIYPACNPTESLNQYAKKIITIKNGKAEKREDKWIVTEKADIAYE